ncbi:MAG: hypothetical protein K2Y37_05185 [Pirellulales bacterium]|nr:hypothetical protein [Pirellulales bacterium]
MYARSRRALPRMRGRALLRQLFVDAPASATAERTSETVDEAKPTRLVGRLAALVDLRVDAPAEPAFTRAAGRQGKRPSAAPRPLASASQAR